MLREMTEGTVDMLRLRSQAKSSIHAEMTIIGPRAVNPLKAAWDVDVALHHLLAPQRTDLMGPVRAVTDAYDDLRAHDRGLAAGIEAALQSLLHRFSPEQFDQRLESGALDRFLPANRKARLWDLLLELYEDIAKEAQEDFWSVFERGLRRASRPGRRRRRRRPSSFDAFARIAQDAGGMRTSPERWTHVERDAPVEIRIAQVDRLEVAAREAVRDDLAFGDRSHRAGAALDHRRFAEDDARRERHDAPMLALCFRILGHDADRAARQQVHTVAELPFVIERRARKQLPVEMGFS
jgi:hypothetical protein